ncbi:hypothetical protein MIND_01234400 [Mycena indigotica]|uniref:ARM repeat-containing protein n=1 Tax=Mycena indigotica TaxID=2126181 RepID=A0A8H6S4I5_9AGAR|nr:uncharacterized protein MIND_01234400 [Mycena indigotica]KAF7292080.1 hypothetical protein MIND_01234400 [Mycena indigotica]
MSFFNRRSKDSHQGSEKDDNGREEKGGNEKQPASGSSSKGSFFGAATRAIRGRWITEQARDLLAAHQNPLVPLTDTTTAKFWEYFTDEYASADTRNLVVLQFTARAQATEAEAHIIASYVRAYPTEFEKLFASPLPKTRAYIALLLGYLAGWPSCSETALGMKPCERLVGLFCDSDREVRDSALFAIFKLAVHPDGAQMAVGANVLQHAPAFLKSPTVNERLKMLHIIANIGKHERTAAGVLTLGLHKTLVSLSSDANLEIQRDALLGIVQLSQFPAGAQALIETTILDRMSLLTSPEAIIRAHACHLLGRLCIHPTVPAASSSVASINLQEQLVSLVSDSDENVSRLSFYALSKLSKLAPGPVARAGATQFAISNLSSTRVATVQAAFEILTNLSRDEASMPLVLAANACGALVGLLENDKLRHNALVVLLQHVKWPDGAELAVQAGILNHLTGLMQPQNDATIKQQAFQIVEQIAKVPVVISALLASNPCPSLALHLSDTNTALQMTALYALATLSSTSAGAQAVLEADTLAAIPLLLHSPLTRVRQHACLVLTQLAKDSETWLAVFSIDPCTRLIELVSDSSIVVVQAAVLALTALSLWPEGREAIAAANMARRSATQEDGGITLLWSADGTLVCSMNIDVPATEATPALSLPFPFRVIRVFPSPCS